MEDPPKAPVGHVSRSAHAMKVPSADVSIVVPTFNEAGNIRSFVSLIGNTLDAINWEIIFVDDDSPDGTWQIVKKTARYDTRIRVIRRVDRRGLAGACIEGILSSSAPYVVVMDVDHQHDEAILPAMLAPLISDKADLIIGTRRTKHSSAGFSTQRAVASCVANWLAQLSLDRRVSDPMSGFFAIKRSAFEVMAPKLSSNGFKLLLDILTTNFPPLRIIEIPYVFRSRRGGVSKFDARNTLDFVALLVHKLSQRIIPIRFVSFVVVGAIGIIVHLFTLRSGLRIAGISFGSAQTMATLAAMTSNFIMNNIFTYKDMQLRGRLAIKGLLKFYMVCGLGATANVGLASWIFGMNEPWWLAGVAGTLVGSVFNFSMSSLFVWRPERPVSSKYSDSGSEPIADGGGSPEA